MNDNNLCRKRAQGSTTGDASELASYMRNDAISKMLVKLLDMGWPACCRVRSSWGGEEN